MAAEKPFEEIYFTARDGLRLYGRHYRAKAYTPNNRRPVLCLPGLTRNSRDFEAVAEALSAYGPAPRDVFTLDLRGRGLSDYDPDWKNYAVPVEMQDVIDYMTLLGLHDAGIIGTSRGGIITMLLAAVQPSRIGAAVLNDIGPVIETDGLIRIAGYVGRIPLPKSWSEAVRVVRELSQRDFPQMSEADAQALARQLFNERDGRPITGYDQKIAKTLSVLDGPVPALWPQFEALKRVPVMVIRGENSDLLSEKTIGEMRRKHQRLTTVRVPNEGHAPLLRDAPTIAQISMFFEENDASYGLIPLEEPEEAAAPADAAPAAQV